MKRIKNKTNDYAFDIMMMKLIYKSRCWIILGLIGLLAACNVRADMDMERTVMEIEGKFQRGEDISQDTAIFQARRYYNLSDDAEMKTLSALYSGCVYWEQNNFDSAMAALNEAVVLAKSSDDEGLIAKVQQTIAELHSDLNRSEEMMEGYLRRRKLLVFLAIAIVAAMAVVVWLLYRTSQKRKELEAMSTSLEELQLQCEALRETRKDNLVEKTNMIYKVFRLGEGKNVDETTFKKMKSCVCGQDANTAYDAIFEAYRQVHPEVVQRIQTQFPSLTEGEFKVCILSLLPFSVKEVADIMGVSSAMIGKYRTNLRKKLGIPEARGSIEEFVQSMD